MLILHQPAPDRFEKTPAAYKALETLLDDGRVRAIGVSNFMPHHLDELLARTDIVPAVNQIELHPFFTQPAVQATDSENGILTQAWSPIGGITFYPGFGENRKKNVMEDPSILAIAQTHAKSPAQVMLRWHLQLGRSAIPKSTNPARKWRTSTSSTSNSALTKLQASMRWTRECVTDRIRTWPGCLISRG